jgi:DNA polymerase-3 subunit epsilon
MAWDERWVVLDVETTGLSPGRDRVIEIGAVAGEGERITGEFHSLIDPARPVPWPAQRVHGITDAMLRGQPLPHEVLPDFYRFLGQGALVAHNAPFDLGFLRSEFARLGLGLANRYHCTLQLCRKAFPSLPNHRLETVVRHLFGRQFMVGAIHELPLHRALADARLTARVWVALNA